MTDYLQIEFQDISADQAALLIAKLTEIGFDGYEETDNGLKAFIRKLEFNKEIFEGCISPFKVSFTKSVIPETNWNEVWESNFEPVVVNDFVAVRAGFHEPVKNVRFEIIITPKMSFGTGHHATTCMMMENMKNVDFSNKKVLDFGTGTGVLAILAEKLGAKKIVAIDNDKWSIENATENMDRNECAAIEILLSDTASLNDQFDVILANINRNVILENLPSLSKQLRAGGVLFLSGLLAEDEPVISEECNKSALIVKTKVTRHNWLFLSLSHT